MLKTTLERVVDKRDGFLFLMENVVPCILHMENRVSEKLITMCLREGLTYRNPGVGATEYFEEVEYAVNNGIPHPENGN